MNCSDFEPIVLSIAGKRVVGQQSVDDSVSGQALAHAALCNRCGARLAEERALLAGVSAVVADLATQEAPSGLEKALLDAFRRHAGARVEMATRATPTSMVARARWIFAAAAAIILAVVVSLAFLRHQPLYQDQDRGNLATPGASFEQPPDNSNLANPASAIGTQAGSDQSPSRRFNPHRSRNARTAPAEATTDFFYLTDDEDDLASLESAQVVRVELPASALVAAGLPADLETEGPTIRADVVLGQDGLARAIRFVR